MKIKHSKFKNTGILFELLVRQIASDTVSNKDSAAIGLVRKYFNKSELAKEYKLYQALIVPKSLSEAKAETFINATLEASLRLNKTALRKEKYNIIKEIRDHYDIEEFFKAKINNYTQYAAVYNLIESHNSLEFTDPQHIIDKAPSAELRPNQKDSDSLPDYSLLDAILYQYIERHHGSKEIIAMGFEKEMVERTLRLVNISEYKRNQFCPIIRVSPKAFGVGRRVPIVANYLS